MDKDRKQRDIEKNFVTYDPDKTGYEKICLCEYLCNLPEISPEEIEGYPENRKEEH